MDISTFVQQLMNSHPGSSRRQQTPAGGPTSVSIPPVPYSSHGAYRGLREAQRTGGEEYTSGEPGEDQRRRIHRATGPTLDGSHYGYNYTHTTEEDRGPYSTSS
ncbi:hypothetical protein M378DRAFT_17011 [Amanita muscaria Koide BX008]|uniref:Uncharacterized protein n=1 Tax=Amanita muscaria (strain Koide BX008) TaxID=946122 RepID=A0A0C2WK33_AMAMK|nr:hypothetical protein M378DRAFT_17011 [Amanita muscaria Koide BX008]